MALRSVRLALAAAIACGSPVHAADGTDEDASHAYALGDFATAFGIWSSRARNGDAQAQFGLGGLYDLGQGVARNERSAYHWYRMAALAGVAEAEFDVGVMRDGGIGVAEDETKAALWYARAAAHGDHRAAYNLGLLYADGDGVPLNAAAAAAWFREADVPAGRARLARMRAQPWAPPGDASPIADRPAIPADASTVTLRPGQPLELVWTANAQPMPVRFFVQVVALDQPGAGSDPAGGYREVFSRTLDVTATVATTGAARGTFAAGQYAWRVYSVAVQQGHYAASDWARFEVRPTG